MADLKPCCLEATARVNSCHLSRAPFSRNPFQKRSWRNSCVAPFVRGHWITLLFGRRRDSADRQKTYDEMIARQAEIHGVQRP